MTTSRLLSAFTSIRRKSEASEIQIAKIGILNASGAAIIDAPGRPKGYVLIRLMTGSDAGTVHSARNTGAAPAFDVQVRCKVDVQANEYVILDVDPFYSLANPTANPASVPGHRHYIGSGLDDPVEARRWIPGRVWSSGGLTINIDAFVYQWNDNVYQFAAVSNHDISAYAPASGFVRYLIVGIDPAANSILLAAGASVPTLTGLTFADIQAISFAGRRSAAIALSATTTYLRETDITDLRDGGGATSASGIDTILTSANGTVLVDANGFVMRRA